MNRLMSKTEYEKWTASTRDARMKWWREARFGMFVHFGLYTVRGMHEWEMLRENFPIAEYEKLADRFNPKPGAPREWAALAKKAGMKYMVMTTRHHEGFSLWDSKVNPYNSVNYGPHRDIVREFVDACRENGLGIGFYSSCMDWHHPDGWKCAFDSEARKRFTDYIRALNEELLTNYGKIDILWYDVSAPMTSYEGWNALEINQRMRELQPDIIINNRIKLDEDFGTPEEHISADARDWEACMTFNGLSWGYVDSEQARPYSYNEQGILRMLYTTSSGGGNLLLNIGPKPDGSVPNNWRAIFGDSAWTWCEARQQYYLHTFAESQPDLNWENPAVRQALYDVANYWADKGACGFRMDAIPYLKKPEGLPDGTPDSPDGTVSIHDMTANTDGLLDFLHEFRQKVQTGRDIFTVGEANGVPAEDLPDWVGANGVFDMIFEFSHINLEFTGAETWCEAKSWTLADLKKALSDSQAATAENGWYPIFFENHDKPRSISHYFPADADPELAGRALGTVLLTLRGTPFLFEGEELGYVNIAWDRIEDYNDLNSKSQYEIALQNGFSEEEAMAFVHRFSRDNARTPMQWDGEANAGFTTGTPWLPVHDDYRTENALDEQADSSSVLSWYLTLTAFRSENEVLLDGTYREVDASNEQIYAFIREDETRKLLTAVNFTGTEATLDLSGIGPDSTDMEILLSSYGEAGDPARPGDLRPYEAVVIELR